MGESRALPFEPHCFRDLLSSGRGATANLASFDESLRRAESGGVGEYVPPSGSGTALGTAVGA